jgi:hypothetical protein
MRHVELAQMNTWVYRAVGTALLILAVVGLGNLIRFFGSSHPKPLEGHSVATDWNESVERMGINPVYPPQEDLHVGDIFAVIKQSDNEYPTSVVFGDHAIKLWHVDMRAALEAGYNAVPVFPRTKERPLHEDDSIWDQNESDDLFHPGGKKTLSLLAFPAFSIQHSRSATAGASTGSGIWSWFSGVFGITRNDEETEQLSFPAAETYGVNSVQAQRALFSFCDDQRTKPFCTDTAVRNMLSMVVGDEIWRPQLDPKTKQCTDQYVSEVELMLVKQVFLTRSIVQLRAAASASGQAARLIAKLKDVSDRPATPPASAAASETPAPGPGAPSSVSAETEKKLLELRAMLDSQSAPGGSILALLADGTTIALKRVYPRPVAIGFRAVSQQPLKNPNDKILSDDDVTVGRNAQPEQPAPAPNGATEPECDDLCKVGRALNLDVTPIQSKSGTGRGVVTKGGRKGWTCPSTL